MASKRGIDRGEVESSRNTLSWTVPEARSLQIHARSAAVVRSGHAAVQAVRGRARRSAAAHNQPDARRQPPTQRETGGGGH